MSNPQSSHTNRLIDETSPYLLQHAHNPVDWHPWGPQALELAVETDRPILLSIGYSACHWCHVMEHESFEDTTTARAMNENFVCIKVDREERPDLDRIYQLCHQMMNRRGGGWPLTVFLTPSGHTPLFAGTYFPREPSHGMPAFVDLLQQVASHYKSNRHALTDHDGAFRQALEANNQAQGAEKLTTELLSQAGNELALSYDQQHGGFGDAPKFPHPTHLQLLIQLIHRQRVANDSDSTQSTNVDTMLAHTLQSMAAGGIYDHLGGGFCRYSVDERWEIPHFEKMLYDNAQLLAIFADASRLQDDATFKDVCVETADWVMREMQAANGGYFSTIDADSEGEEGKFYAFNIDEVRNQLSDIQWRIVEVHYGLNLPPNFEGKWHLAIKQPVDKLPIQLKLDPQEIKRELQNARRALFSYRQLRVAPALDDKILTSWNGLMIGGMARAGYLLEQPTWVDSASRAVDFLRQTLWKNGRLLATSRNGKTHLNAYLDDYVYCIDGLLELLQARWRDEDLDFAVDLAECLLTHFMDSKAGGFYFTSDDHERLVHRPKPGMDDAIPSGNGIAAKALQRLGHLLGEPRYLDAATATLHYLSHAMTRYASAYGSTVCAVEEHLSPAETIVLRHEADADIIAWTSAAVAAYSPSRMVIAIPSSATSLPGVLGHRQPRAAVTAYICRGFSCSEPVLDIEQFKTMLAR